MLSLMAISPVIADIWHICHMCDHQINIIYGISAFAILETEMQVTVTFFLFIAGITAIGPPYRFGVGELLIFLMYSYSEMTQCTLQIIILVLNPKCVG